ncbi:MAG: hypothetical protein QF824_03525 [Candidatus Woesearchaeota archaeon]|nr:hypothetical protein [Candidatus Woesearchaeota archaeon]
MIKKKGQGGVNAALLVAIIAGVIILYVLFLPVGEKEELFGESTSTGGGNEGGGADDVILLSEGPEQISPFEKLEDIDIPNIYLIEAINANEIERVNAFSVRNGLFDDVKKVVQFDIDDLDNTDNVLLSFSAAKRKGNLIIKLNDEVIYNFAPSKVNIVVELRKEKLEGINSLEFSVSSVGAAFWATNEYGLDDVRIIGDITDRSRQESRNIFEITSGEFENLEKTSLRFIPYCSNIANVGILDVFVNNRNVYSAAPVCDDPVKIPILGATDIGENNVVFKTSMGSYSIEQITVELESKDARSLSFFFELDDEQYADVQDGDKSVNLTIAFVDDDELKKADIKVNGKSFPRQLDQDEPYYNKQLRSSQLEEGNNYIEIVPKKLLKIVDLELILWD